MNREFPCKCGHIFFFHDRRDYGYTFEEESWCIATMDCECVKYTPSNLRYLELKYALKKKK